MAKGKGKRQATTGDGPLAEYERRRRERIRENEARMEALGLPSLASSLRVSAPDQQEDDGGCGGGGKTRKRQFGADPDEDYLPSDEDHSSQGQSEDEEECEDNSGKHSLSGARQRSNPKGNSKSIPVEGKVRKQLFEGDCKEEFHAHDEDTALSQAIALSLGKPLNSDAVPSIQSQNFSKNVPRKGSARNGDCLASSGRGKRKKETVKRVQVTEDEAVAYFFSFDESGKGGITLQDLQRLALAHDFCWSDKEMAAMIHLFDTDGDGKLSFGDFQKIISRCKMLVVGDS